MEELHGKKFQFPCRTIMGETYDTGRRGGQREFYRTRGSLICSAPVCLCCCSLAHAALETRYDTIAAFMYHESLDETNLDHLRIIHKSKEREQEILARSHTDSSLCAHCMRYTERSFQEHQPRHQSLRSHRRVHGRVVLLLTRLQRRSLVAY